VPCGLSNKLPKEAQCGGELRGVFDGTKKPAYPGGRAGSIGG